MNRALVIRLGNPDIAEAIADGMKRAQRPNTQESVRRLAMRRHSPEEWEAMIIQARYDYGQNAPTGRVRRFLLAAWACIWVSVYGMAEYLMELNRR